MPDRTVGNSEGRYVDDGSAVGNQLGAGVGSTVGVNVGEGVSASGLNGLSCWPPALGSCDATRSAATHNERHLLKSPPMTNQTT